MKLIVGLGNPGNEYKNTYHNIGFMTLDKVKTFFDDLQEKKECQAVVFHTKINGEKVFLAYPQTYMNASGKSVLALKSKYKISNNDIFVLVDDIDLPKGKFRFREKGSAGTHNGLRSIVENIGEDFNRLRIGIGNDKTKDLCDFVLSKIDNESMSQINIAIDDAIKTLLEKLK